MLEFEDINDELTKKIDEKCKPGLMPVASIRVIPSNCVMPREFKPYAERLMNFEVREDDVWVISYPKCGTTWTQELVWLLGNNFDYDTAKQKLQLQRFPFLEAVSIINQNDLIHENGTLFGDTISFVQEMPSPRFIKSHLPVQLLPKDIFVKKPKIIYVTREPKDAAVSYYHHHRLWNGYEGSFDDFMKAFLEDKVVYSPFWSHVNNYKKLAKTMPNVLINSYEDMQLNLPEVIKKTAKFLEKPINDKQLKKLTNHLSFDSMKNNPAINGEEFIKDVIVKYDMPRDDPELTFIRKGIMGSWKKEMSPELVKKFDEWAEINGVEDDDQENKVNV
ncbi:hypothetical protein WDU94_009492 [Cyamophila willieti]